MSETRRLFIKSLAAFTAIGASSLPEIGPSKVYAPTAEELAKGEAVARVPHMLRYLDECGAVFAACPGFPGWYQATWRDPDFGDEPQRWAASVDEGDFDHLYAQAFRLRVEQIPEKTRRVQSLAN